MDRIKDFLYEKSDIFFAIVVFSIATLIITYNLSGWLYINDINSKYNKQITSTKESISSDESQTSEKKINEVTKPEESNTQNITSTNNSALENNSNTSTSNIPSTNSNAGSENLNNAVSTTSQTQDKNNTQTSSNSKPSTTKIKNIKIPSGSTAQSIAKILKENELISDEKVFVNTLISSKKDTKLKAGDYKIPENSNIEQIISILTK